MTGVEPVGPLPSCPEIDDMTPEAFHRGAGHLPILPYAAFEANE